MRSTNKRQMLTTGVIDLNGNRVSPDVINWSEFDLNPVLLYDEEYEGHRGVVVGRVVNRERTGAGFSAILEFLENVAVADVAWEKYRQGAMPFVSIGGYARGSYDEEGVFVAEDYLMKEVSLVAFPANLEARTIEEKEVAASDSWFAENTKVEGKTLRFLRMTCKLEDVEAEAETETETETEEKKVEASETETSETEEKKVEASEAETSETEEKKVEASETETSETEEKKVEASEAETSETEEKAVEASEAEAEEKAVEAEEKETEATEAKDKMPEGMSWHEQSVQTKYTKTMNKTFKQLNCDAAFQARLNALNSAFQHGAPAADNTAENVETVKMLASAMLADERMVIIASATNFTNGVSKERVNGLRFLVECAAGGAAASTLAAADLGIIKWLSLFYEKLLPNNTFMRSLRFVPMSDREGAIYVESGINPATYVGSVTPVNAPNYMYDDIKRTIARQVFSIQPVTFQHADMAILAYDKQSWGWQIAMDSLMSDVATYVLQVIANTEGIAKIGTTGETLSTAGMFPLEAPNSSLNIKGLTARDLLSVQGEMLKQNFRLEGRMVETVLPAALFTELAKSPDFLTNLTRDLEGTIRNELRFMGNRVTSRNPVARVNTANGNAELDPSLYADGTVDSDTGAISSITPAVTTAQHVGAGLAFVEGEVIAGIGTIDVIVMPDPANYGVTMSGWMSAGATVAREGGKGVALIVPTVA